MPGWPAFPVKVSAHGGVGCGVWGVGGAAPGTPASCRSGCSSWAGPAGRCPCGKETVRPIPAGGEDALRSEGDQVAVRLQVGGVGALGLHGGAIGHVGGAVEADGGNLQAGGHPHQAGVDPQERPGGLQDGGGFGQRGAAAQIQDAGKRRAGAAEQEASLTVTLWIQEEDLTGLAVNAKVVRAEAQYSQGYTLWGTITDNSADTAAAAATVTLVWPPHRVNDLLPTPGVLHITAQNCGWGAFPCHWFGVDHFNASNRMWSEARRARRATRIPRRRLREEPSRRVPRQRIEVVYDAA